MMNLGNFGRIPAIHLTAHQQRVLPEHLWEGLCVIPDVLVNGFVPWFAGGWSTCWWLGA